MPRRKRKSKPQKRRGNFERILRGILPERRHWNDAEDAAGYHDGYALLREVYDGLDLQTIGRPDSDNA